MYASYGPSIAYQVEYGIGVLSKAKPLRTETYNSGRIKRSLLVVELPGYLCVAPIITQTTRSVVVGGVINEKIEIATKPVLPAI